MMQLLRAPHAAAGAARAKAQLERNMRAIAWVHSEAGASLPKFQACLVVPRAQRSMAEQWLGRLLRGNWQAAMAVPRSLRSAPVVWTVDTL